jgi:predicted aspartyl protease
MGAKSLKVFAVLLVVLFLASCNTKSFKNQKEDNKSLYNLGNYSLSDSRDTIAIDFDNYLPTCTVYIKGKVYKFLIDTGALTLISDEIFNELGLKEYYRNKFSDINNKSNSVIYTVIPELKISNTTFNNIGSAVVVLTEPLSCFYDGIIGANLMSKLHWSFNYGAKTVIISDIWSEVEIENPDFTWSFNYNNQKTPYLLGGVLKSKGSLLFDTGASHGINVTNNYNYYQQEVDSNKFITKIGINNFGLFGAGKADKSFIMQADVFVGKDTLKNQIVHGGAKSLIGNSFLKDYAFNINWATKEIQLKRNNHNQFLMESIYEGFGYSAYFINGKLTVISMIEEAGLPLFLGDEILMINDKDYTKISDKNICDYIAVGNQSDLSKINLLVVRNQDTLSIELKKQQF